MQKNQSRNMTGDKRKNRVETEQKEGKRGMG
jgi:hypothetical protein